MIPGVERQGQATARDGRTLAFVERGAEDGMPVLVCHGTPGSRFTRHPDRELYDRHGENWRVAGQGGGTPPPGWERARAGGG